ncbi:Uncharacterized membrane protein YckC, RDD family [Bhargavaea ginsengi]|uniref:Uncharacterized membrane protein YckC, RDD family n=1 Tax=Bhargavaea ginsengi TaxID=426757 RepID=A0A1H6ZFC0_9BACL|nr:RDD family protein [Bhargavaea ginsengi]SEJ52008.1 Uncharacterized membrane protein YckC, RDD family [Bhargavaea ginsengi]
MNAGFPVRLKAFLLDYVLIVAYGLTLMVFSMFLIPSSQQLFTASPASAQLAGFLMITLPVSLYFILTDSRLGAGSFGKRIAGIRVKDMNDRPLSVLHSAVRTALKFMPWELSHFLVYRLMWLGDEPVPIGYMVIGGLIYSLIGAYIAAPFFTKKKQSVYDMAARTQVIRLETTEAEQKPGSLTA